MVWSLRLFLILCIFVYLGIIINMLRAKSLNLKYTLLWIFSAVLMILVIAFPGFIYWFSGAVGVVNPVNMVFMLVGMFSILILLSLTVIVSHLNSDKRKLTQTLALLEKRVRELEKKES